MRSDYGVNPASAITFVEGDRCWLIDNRGQRYLDLFGGAGRALVGHGQGTSRLSGLSVLANRHNHHERAKVAALLEDAVGGEWRVIGYFTTGGEAIDIAARVALSITGRSTLAACEGAFHGRVGLARALTDPRYRNEQEQKEVTRIPLRTGSDIAIRPDLGAFVVEPVQGSAGNRPLAPELIDNYITAIRGNGGLVISDEVFGAVGRTGSPVSWPSTAPAADLMVVGKGIGNGVPVSAVLVRESLATDAFGALGTASSTFAGNPLALAALEATLDSVTRLGLIHSASILGSRMQSLLRDGMGRVRRPVIVQGKGMMIGVDLGDPVVAQTVRSLLQKRGILVGATDKAVRVNPPLTISEEEVEWSAAALIEAIEEALA